jgi:hypothetical protein
MSKTTTPSDRMSFKVLTIEHDGKQYQTTDVLPQNGDLVLTEQYGVWEFRDETGHGSASMPYWANKYTCKKLIPIG